MMWYLDPVRVERKVASIIIYFSKVQVEFWFLAPTGKNVTLIPRPFLAFDVKSNSCVRSSRTVGHEEDDLHPVRTD